MIRIFGFGLILAFVSFTTPCSAQTKEQCATLARSIPQLAKNTGTTAGYLWDLLIPVTSGAMKRAAETASQAQAALISALRAYSSALDDVIYHAQICAQ